MIHPKYCSLCVVLILLSVLLIQTNAFLTPTTYSRFKSLEDVRNRRGHHHSNENALMNNEDRIRVPVSSIQVQTTRNFSALLVTRYNQSSNNKDENDDDTNNNKESLKTRQRHQQEGRQSAKKRYQQQRQEQRKKNSNRNGDWNASYQRSKNSNYRNGNGNSNSNNNNNSNNNSNNYKPERRRTTIDIDLSKPTFTYQTLAPALQLASDHKPLPKRKQSTSINNTKGTSPSNNNNQNNTNKKTIQPSNPYPIPPAKYVTSPSVQKQNAQYCIPYICGELPIIYTNDPKSVEKWACDNIMPDNNNIFSFIGFDVEAVPNVPWRKKTVENSVFYDRPSTVQLSTPFSSIVIQLTSDYDLSSRNHNNDQLKPLQAILSDPTIIKAGAGIDDDMLELYRWNNSLQAKCRFDIGGIGSTSSGRRVGLQRLVRAIVGVELVKSKRVTMSDWSQVPLSMKQLNYASRDAWAGAAVIENLSLMYEDAMNVDLIGSKILDIERDMEELDIRARQRKRAKKKVKNYMNEMKNFSKYIRKGVDYLELEDGEEINLVERMEYLKDQFDYNRQIMDETAPDGLLFFPPEMLGLDFSFEDKVRSMNKSNVRSRKV